MIRRRLLAAIATPVMVACAALRGTPAAPHIDRVVPDSVLLAPGAVIEVVIQGSGFTAGKAGRNIIRFGDAKIADVPADDAGREIRLTIPQVMPSQGDAAPSPLESGRYTLRVENGAGVSNTVNLRIDR